MTQNLYFFILCLTFAWSYTNSKNREFKLSELTIRLRVPSEFIRLSNSNNLIGVFPPGDVVFRDSINDKRIDLFIINLNEGENIENSILERKINLSKINVDINFITDKSKIKFNPKNCFQLEYIMPSRDQKVKAYGIERYFKINKQKYLLIFYHTRNQAIHSLLPTKEAKEIICSLKILKSFDK